MPIKQTLTYSLRTFLALKKERSDPLWARLLVGSALALSVAMGLMVLSVFLMGSDAPGWMASSLSNNLPLGLCAACAMMFMLRGFELLMPGPMIEALSARSDWRPAAVVSVLLIAGMVVGVRLGYMLLGYSYSLNLWKKLSDVPMVQLKFLIFALFILAVNWIWWLLRAKENALAQQAAESQLRMLQAQIEPHFLFNTLANVHSQIANDAPRAQLMLESFTDYLRGSLGQMRVSDSTLDVELETARNYLQLMQIRMGDRLRFSIEVSEQARKALLPPLLLQPLVENAVHHGLEPKLEGGIVRLFAAVKDGRLDIRIEDDGLGLHHARRPARAGSGVALANIRARLCTRYGAQASLVLASLDEGTRSSLTLPYSASGQVSRETSGSI